jgi:hypothetical protein
MSSPFADSLGVIGPLLFFLGCHLWDWRFGSIHLRTTQVLRSRILPRDCWSSYWDGRLAAESAYPVFDFPVNKFYQFPLIQSHCCWDRNPTKAEQ